MMHKFSRRDLLGFASLAFGVAMFEPGAAADPQVVLPPNAPLQKLDAALLEVMKAGDRTPFPDRYRMLEPVVAEVFDLEAVLAASIGLSWLTLPPSQQAALATAFRRYTVASYVSNFDSYNGQSFQILPTPRKVGNGEVVVSTRLVRVNDSPVKLDYVMRLGSEGWRAVDVLTNGSISRVAVQRSDFSQLLASGGVPALAAGLGRKVATLSGGALLG